MYGPGKKSVLRVPEKVCARLPEQRELARPDTLTLPHRTHARNAHSAEENARAAVLGGVECHTALVFFFLLSVLAYILCVCTPVYAKSTLASGLTA